MWQMIMRRKEKKRDAYLQSKNLYNYRHGEENPRIIGVIHLKPGELEERLCYKVEYESDGKIDYVPISDISYGYWKII